MISSVNIRRLLAGTLIAWGAALGDEAGAQDQPADPAALLAQTRECALWGAARDKQRVQLAGSAGPKAI